MRKSNPDAPVVAAVIHLPSIIKRTLGPAKPSNRLMSLAVLLLSAIIATGAVELSLRLFVLSPVPTVTDPVLGRLLKPNTRYRQSSEGYSSFTTNALGFNDASIPIGASDAILVLGDSYVESQQVDPAVNFLADFRRQNPHRLIVAAGRAGLSPLSYNDLARYVAPHVGIRDIIVVLNFTDVKDILESDVTMALSKKDGHVTGLGNREQIRPEGAEADAFRFLVAHSSIFAQINQKYIDWIKADAQKLRTAVAWLRTQFSTTASAIVSGANSESPLIGRRPKTVADVENIMVYLLTELRNQAPVRIIYVPQLDYRSNRVVEERAESATARQVFTCAALRSHTPMLDLNEPLSRVFKDTGQPPNGFSNSSLGSGHLNVVGHAVLAKAIADVIEHPLVPEDRC